MRTYVYCSRQSHIYSVRAKNMRQEKTNVGSLVVRLGMWWTWTRWQRYNNVIMCVCDINSLVFDLPKYGEQRWFDAVAVVHVQVVPTAFGRKLLEVQSNAGLLSGGWCRNGKCRCARWRRTRGCRKVWSPIPGVDQPTAFDADRVIAGAVRNISMLIG